MPPVFLDNLPAGFPTKDAKVLYRLPKVKKYRGDNPKYRGLIVDVESNCIEGDDAELVQVCLLPFTFNDDMVACEVMEPYVGYQMPTKADWDMMGSLLRLTQEDLLRKPPVSPATVTSEFEKADVIIAHSASFDRRLIERTFGVPGRVWACSVKDLPWKAMNASAKLDWISAFMCGFWYDSHEAEEDCRALLHVLNTRITWADGEDLALRKLLSRAMAIEWRIRAFNSPFETKDKLKQRGYRWDPDDRVWWKDVVDSDRDSEVEWLNSKVYWNGEGESMDVMPIDPLTRHME